MTNPEQTLTRPLKSGRKVVLWFGILVFIFFGILVGLKKMVQAPPRSLPTLAQAPATPLLERSGEQTTLGALKGRVLIIDLQTTDCGAACEERDRQMQTIQEYIAPVAEDSYQLSILSEPTRLEQLNRLAATLGSKSGWRWFTTDADHFAALKQSLLPDATADLALLDREGNLRHRYLTSRLEDRRELMLDIRALAREHAKSPTRP